MTDQEKIEKVLALLELSAFVGIANQFGNIEVEEAGLHYSSIAKEICQLFERSHLDWAKAMAM